MCLSRRGPVKKVRVFDMPDTDGALHLQVRRAAEKLQGTKFCFRCQSYRPIDKGEQPKGKSWRCFSCLGKLKEASNERK